MSNFFQESKKRCITKASLTFAVVAWISLSFSCINLANNNIKTSIYDVIIVPGVPIECDGWICNNYSCRRDTINQITDIDIKCKGWNSIMKKRVLWAIYLYNNNYTDHIIFSGGAVHSPYIEAEIMALYAIKLGIPSSKIIIESQSEHSVENLCFSLKIAKENGYKKIAFTSNDFQLVFIKNFIQRKNLNSKIDLLPIEKRHIKNLDTVNISIDYSKALKKDFIPLNDRKRKTDRLKGTLGTDLDCDY